MRYSIPLLTVCSGLVLVTTGFFSVPGQVAAAEIKTDSRIAAASSSHNNLVKSPEASTQVVCSRNRPLEVKGEHLTVSSLPENLTLASKVVKLFCRDFRISTMLVRDYCAVVRE